MDIPTLCWLDLLQIENLLISNQGTIKLCDFGSATTVSHYPDYSWSAQKRSMVEDEVHTHTHTHTHSLNNLYNTVFTYSTSSRIVGHFIWAQNSLIIHTCTQKDSHLYVMIRKMIHTCVSGSTLVFFNAHTNVFRFIYMYIKSKYRKKVLHIIFSIYSQSDVSSILSQSHEHAPTRVWFIAFMT